MTDPRDPEIGSSETLPDERWLARQLAALSESKRLGILRSLADGERCACDLAGCCGDRQSLLSFHLRRLRETGLVEVRREGRWMRYSLNREAIRSLAAALDRLADGTRPGGPRC